MGKAHSARPGTVHRRGPNDRFYWRVTLPGETRRKEIPLRPAGHQHATTDAKIAEQIADALWRDAALGDAPAHFTGSVASLTSLYMQWARDRYRHANGAPTSQVSLCRSALAYLVRGIGTLPAEDMNASLLEGVRRSMVDADLARRTVNTYTKVIKHAFKWGAQQGLLSPHVYGGLIIVDGMRAGEAGVRETPPVTTVAREHVQAAIDHAPSILADMIRLHALTGMRPGELVTMRPADVDRVGVEVRVSPEPDARVWLYRPRHHKTKHRGKERTIVLGPQAQAILAPYLLRDPETPCFSPAEVVRERGTRVRRYASARAPGDAYTTQTYARAVRWALLAARRALVSRLAEGMGIGLARERAKVAIPLWAPNRLRHNVATAAARTSLDVSSALLGHTSLNTTLIYAERDMHKAAAWAAKHG
ncbi:MAG TPA: site-specific integrase [Armatimonadota bacterium]|nr:site-specific integrase [Armatimonadota bacterium]